MFSSFNYSSPHEVGGTVNYFEETKMSSTECQQNTAVPYKGLWNQGSTCYLNSVLQVLFMTPDFRKALQRSPPGSIDSHLKELFDDLQRFDGLTYKITKALGITNVYAQADAAECFEKILRNMTNPEAFEIFQGVLRVKNKCSTCNTETCDDNPCWSLPLELVDSQAEYRVEDGITQYFRPSEVSGPDQLFCEKCNTKTDSTVKLEMKHHPEVQMLLLKRFKFDYDSMCYYKVERRVEIPCNLKIQSQTYELYASVKHHGNLKCGHYTANIKSQEDTEWYCFNDIKVERSYKSYQLDERETSRSAYLLFYRKTYAEDALTEESNKASTNVSSETLRGETNQPHECDEETGESQKIPVMSRDRTESQEKEGKDKENFKKENVIMEKKKDSSYENNISAKQNDDFEDQTRMSAKKEDDFEDQTRMSAKKEDDSREQTRMSAKKEDDSRDQTRMSAKKEDDSREQTRMSAKKEDDSRDQTRMSAKQQKDEENTPLNQVKSSVFLTKYDLCKSSHEQKSNYKSTENKIHPRNLTDRGSFQGSVNTEMVQRADCVHNSNVSTLVKGFVSLSNEAWGQSREDPSNVSVEHDEGSRNNSRVQQRDSGTDAGNKQRTNDLLPQTGGTTLTNDGCDDGSCFVQCSGGLPYSSNSVTIQNQRSGKKYDSVTKRTQHDEVVCVQPKRKCSGETGHHQLHKHNNEQIFQRNGQNEPTLNHPERSSDDIEKRTPNRFNMEKREESYSSCNQRDHKTEHSKTTIQQDATHGLYSASQHHHFQQCSTKHAQMHTAPSTRDVIEDKMSRLENSLQKVTFKDKDDLTNTPVKTESRNQQIVSNTHGYNLSQSPIHGCFLPVCQNPQGYEANPSLAYTRHNMPVLTDIRSHQRLINTQCGYPTYQNPQGYNTHSYDYPTYQNPQGYNTHSYDYPTYQNPQGYNTHSYDYHYYIPAENVEPMHPISAPHEPASSQSGSGIRSNTQFRSESPK